MDKSLLLKHLEYWILEMSPDGTPNPQNSAPSWSGQFDLLFSTSNPELCPLGSFLNFVRYEWQADIQPTPKSDIWWETDGGEDHAYRAEGVALNGKHFVLVQRLGEDFRRQHEILQLAREQTLAGEQLESKVHRRTEQIRDREIELSTRLISAACARDEETGAHIRRIGLYSAAMARLLGWSLTEQEDIEAAAPMHDIGKIAIPDRVLRKPGPLTPAERKIMMTHPILGAQILEDSEIPMLKMAADIALCHHEKFDGAGYPNGLSGNEIPVAAQITAVADVYDALVHERVYKTAIPEPEALKILNDMRGHFDPDLLNLFIDNVATMRAIRLANPDDGSPDDSVALHSVAARR